MLDRFTTYRIPTDGDASEELVKITSVSVDFIKVRSIEDDYEFEYEREYFIKHAIPVKEGE